MRTNWFSFSPEPPKSSRAFGCLCSACSEGKHEMSMYAQAAYTADHAMESWAVPWVIVQKTAPACLPGNKHFFVVWEQASLELNEEGCCSPQRLECFAVPGGCRSARVCFFVIFLLPTSCSERGSRRKAGDLMVQLCNLPEPGIKTHCSCGAGTSLWLGALASWL